ncbi:MAG: hypothetical protein COA96_13645 [SAR86 cluster bacterium]|uniref:YdhG-like domain-containing protein n=1 Tax=SAR86 cluster bacterium TaxID=2030880 RepID=A0A2A5ATX9_9GAMM|nr:MAG: hypothetical protein COA96_13645 [SAR86 cluster bacterium]
MTKKQPKSISEYIDAVSDVGKPHLNELYTILKDVAPNAQETFKWGHPFFVEPRFVYAFSAHKAHKAHIGFTSSNAALDKYRDKLQDYEITKMGIIKIPYNKPFPKAVIKKVAKARLKLVTEREDQNFW